jgi:hypothetical protein
MAGVCAYHKTHTSVILGGLGDCKVISNRSKRSYALDDSMTLYVAVTVAVWSDNLSGNYTPWLQTLKLSRLYQGG